MSRYYTDDFYVDTRLLRDHVSKLREERKNAARLYANVRAMREHSSPEDAYKYKSLLRDIEQMMAYFDRMGKVLSDAADEADYLSRKIGNMIDKDTARSRHDVRKYIML